MALLLRLCQALAITVALGVVSGCATMGVRSAVTMSVRYEDGTPQTALVYIDGQFIGRLGYVAKKGVRLPEGEHRISVEKNGYYPFDTIVVSNRKPISVNVKMIRLPD